ncbi:MAG: ABC transporter permease [Acidobacteria bacterium]|nr:ABC transporter permease [Acidobacteriota bacterium]
MREFLAREFRLACRSLTGSGKGARLQVLTMMVCQLPLLCLVSVFDATVWKALPFASPEALYVVKEGGAAIRRWEAARLQPGQLQGLAAFGSYARIEAAFVGPGSAAAQVNASAVSESFFETLRPPMRMGTWPLVSGPSGRVSGETRQAVISEEIRQKYFSGGTEVIGQPFTLNGIAMTVAGVLEGRAAFPEKAGVWFVREKDAEGAFRGAIVYDALVRLRAGVSQTAAEAELNAALQDLGKDERDKRSRLVSLQDYLDRDHVTAVRVSLGIALVLFVVGLVNVATILSYEMASSERATAIRMAAGATPGTLLQEICARQAILAGVSWAIALAMTPGLTQFTAAMVGLAGGDVPHFPSGRAMAAVLVLSVAAGALTPLWQFWFVARVNLATALQQNAQSLWDNRRLVPVRRGMAAAQVMMTTALVALAGIALSQYVKTSTTPLGFQFANVWTSDIALAPTRFASGESQRLAMQNLLRELQAALPGMRVGAVNYLPLDRRQSILLRLQPEGSAAAPVFAGFRVVGGDYFEAMGISSVAGLNVRQAAAAPGKCRLVINDELARKLSWGAAAVGKKAAITGFRDGCEILAVVGSIRHFGPREAAGPEFYMLYDDMPSPFMSLTIAGNAPEAQIREAVLRASAALRDGGPHIGLERLSDKFEQLMAPQRQTTVTILVVSLMALILTLVGLYGGIIRDLHFRAKRLAIEQALGASAQRLFVSLLAERLGEVALAAAVGCALAAYAVRRLPLGIDIPGQVDYWGAAGMAALVVLGCGVFLTLALWPITRRTPSEILRMNG